MNHRPQRLSLSLQKDGLFTLPDAHDVDIACQSGLLWITLDHDRRDIVLAPGESFRGDTHRGAVVSALEPSCVRFSASDLSVVKAPESPRPSWSPWRLRAHGMSPA